MYSVKAINENWQYALSKKGIIMEAFCKERIILGRTGLEVSVAGLGGGGFSRLGMKQGLEHAAAIVREAAARGVTFFDTAMAYGTESAVGQGLSGLPRSGYVISSKFTYVDEDGKMKPPQALMDCLEDSLRRLNTDYVDIYHLHAVSAEDYPTAADTFVPMLIKAREQGKLRFTGLTERFFTDTAHKMLPVALRDDFFDVIMTGYNILNPSSARTVLPLTIEKNIGVLCMFAVRNALHNPVKLREMLDRILAEGQGEREELERDGMLEFITDSGVAHSLPEAAYRFCRHTPGIHVTLTGTSNPEHLRQNLVSIGMPALPPETLARLAKLFGRVNCISAQ